MKTCSFFCVFSITALFAGACLNPPAAEQEHPCELAQNCIYDAAAGSSNCKDGYTWENPDDASNYNCVLMDSCQPVTCEAQGFNCGDVPDGCDTILNCGTCPAGQTCGAGGPNICGEGSCTPTTCAAQGANCGSISDGCGGILDCGTCPEGQTCGGGGVDNVCGSTTTEPPTGLDNAHLLQETMSLWDGFACAVMENDNIACWGSNHNDRLLNQSQSGNHLGVSSHCNLDPLGNIQCLQFYQYSNEMHNIPGGPFKQMTAYGGSLVAIDNNGALHAFDTQTSAPHADITPPTGEGFISVSLGMVACTLDENGTIACWPYTDGYTDTYGLLSGVPTAGDYKQVLVGSHHICALSTAGQVSCWGINDGSAWNDDGQVTDAPTSGTYTAMAITNMASCALSSEGQVKCWGEGYYDGIETVATGSNFKTLAMSESEVCMRDANGVVQCVNSNIPEMMQNTFADMDITRGWICGVTTEGQAICNDHEYLPWSDIDANGPYTKIANWYPRSTNSNKRYNLCALGTNQRLHCWAEESGYGSPYVANAVANLTTTQFTDVGLGQSFGCGLDVDQKIICFGANDLGQTNAPTDSQYTALSVGTCKSCAIDTAGKMSCWGYSGGGDENTYKVVSTSHSGVCSSSYTWAIDTHDELAYWGVSNSPDTAGTYKDVATGGADACAITTAGAVKCWGMSEEPTGASNFDSIYVETGSGSSAQACALTTEGKLTCWGNIFIPAL